MARVSSNNITSLSDDWGCDPLDDNKPFSGAAVQQFIKSYLGAISRASYFDSTSNTLYWFASDDDKSAFIGDTTLTNLVLFSTTMSFASELFRIVLTNNNGSTTINVATNEPTINLSIDFDVQTKTMTESAWRNTGKGVYVSVQVDAGTYGDYVTVMNPRFFAAESTVVVDVRSYIVVGQNRVKVNFVSEDDNTVVSSITYTISMTEMFIEPLSNEWYKPIVETGDISNYKLGGFRIIGAVNKTLHIDIYNGDNKLLQFTKTLGTTAYDRVPYYYTKDAGLDLSSLSSGVYLVSAYITSGTLTSSPVNYNIIYIATGDETTAQFVAINDAADVVYNYTTSTLFKYCLYNGGTLIANPEIRVKQITGTTPTIIVDTTISNVSTGEEHSYEVSLEWLTEETLNLYVQGEIIFGNEQIVRANLDNSSTFPPTYGYDFYLNAATRSNSDLNKLKIINIIDHEELTPVWENMVWIDGIDGWTTDDIDRPCLYLPAGTHLRLPYSEYKIMSGEGISIEMCYRISNVIDYNEIAIAVMSNLESAGFTGMRIRPTNITVHSSTDTSAANDLIRGTNVKEDEVVHLIVTIFQNFSGNSGMNLVTGYINGCKNFQFSYDTGSVFNVDADLNIGCNRSDVSLYFMRIYHSVLSDAAVQANYINSLKDVASRTDLSILLKSCMDSSQTSINFENVKNNDFNYFVIEMLNGASLPSRANGWDKTQKGLSNIEMHFGKQPSWDWRIEGVETAGQGTTSMNYYLWNLRWRIDKSNGDDKKVNVQYLESRTKHSNSYQYTWGTTAYSKTLNFDGTQHPPLKRMTAKINFASSMQSHKIGATRAYTELYDAIGLSNEAQSFANRNNLNRPAVSVYQYPAFGFQKIGNIYQFIGLFTIGPDKGDKPTFGYDIDDSIKNELISIEGTDHSRKMVMFNYPWNSDVQYLYSNECLNIVKGVDDYDNGWEVGNCHGLDTDKSTGQTAVQTALEAEFKPAYDLVYENSTLIFGIPLGVYGATASATLTYINSHIPQFQSQLDENNRMTYANYQFWIEGEYKLYYYDIVDSVYKVGQNLVTQHGSPSGSTVSEKNEWFKNKRRIAFKAAAENYWDIQDALYHFDFIMIFGAMDNFGKNTYPYKMATLAHGGRWKWRQDDLDSILGIGNTGSDNMPNWMEFQDSQNGSVYFGGSTSVFWNLIYECYYDNYTSTVDDMIHLGIIGIGKEILEAMSSLAGGTNTYDGIMKYMKSRFWNNAQEYFPQSAYNADAALKYETAWLANGQEVPPLTQSLGNHYSAEQYWSNLRMIYMMSLFKAGAFGSYADTSLGQIAFRPQSLQSLTVKPYIDLYPAFASGQGMVSSGRTRSGQTHTFVGPFGNDGQTTHYINATNLLTDLGDWKDFQLGAQYVNTVQIQGKKLTKFKIGDEVGTNIITPAVYYTQEECNSANALLEGAISSGTTLTSAQAILVNEAIGTTYTQNSTISSSDANSYNMTLEGAITTESVKTPAVTTPNVTTNIPGLLFDNTYCLEELDARYAQSLSGSLDLSRCTRLRRVYLEGTSISIVSFKNGQKIETLHYPSDTRAVLLRNMMLLTDLQLPTNLSGITTFLSENNIGIDAVYYLYQIFTSENSSIQYFRIVNDDGIVRNISENECEMFNLIAQGKDKDENPKSYGSVSPSGSVISTSNPYISEIVSIPWIYKQTLDEMHLSNVRNYDASTKIGIYQFFGNLNVIYNPQYIYLKFADPEAERVVSVWAGNGEHITESQVQAQTSFPISLFRNNTVVTSFEEFEYFENITTLSSGSSPAVPGSFGNCTKLKRVKLPSGLTALGDYTFYNCSDLEYVKFSSALTTIGAYSFVANNKLQTLDFSECTSLTNIPGNSFYNCTSKVNIDLSNCSSLVSANLLGFSDPGEITIVGNNTITTLNI